MQCVGTVPTVPVQYTFGQLLERLHKYSKFSFKANINKRNCRTFKEVIILNKIKRVSGFNSSAHFFSSQIKSRFNKSCVGGGVDPL